MATADSQSNLDAGAAAEHSKKPSIWLDGDVLACACPDCGSPMSIRIWLLVADCWRCGASLELSEEQEQEAMRLLEEREQAAKAPPPVAKVKPKPEPQPPPKPAAAPPMATIKTPPKTSPPAAKPAPPPPAKTPPPAPVVKQQPAEPAPPQPEPRTVFKSPPPEIPTPTAPQRLDASKKPSRVRTHLDVVKEEGEVTLWFRRAFEHLPAWLASAILHMALLVLLASIWFVQEPEPERPLLLSTRVSAFDDEGAFEEEEMLDPIEFDDPGDIEPAKDLLPEPAEQQDVFDEKPVDPGVALGNLENPLLTAVSPVTGGRGHATFVGRNAESRARLAKAEGGTIASEAAVARGLEWLARHQNANGSWSLNRFNKAGDCRGRCTHAGGHSDTSATALALLPFLGAGQTQLKGDYTTVVRKGLYWLTHQQRPDGDLRGSGIGRMYAHGQASIVLCEAFALTRDESLRAPAQKALDFIIAAQHKAGGWRYSPGQAGDTSVVGWQLMALRSGQIAYLNVPQETFDKANKFIDSVQRDSSGGRYSYMPKGGENPTMTAEALLCRQYAGWPQSHPGMISGSKWLLEEHPPGRGAADLYYWYYATQVFHHMGGAHWEQWNSRIRDLLVAKQETKGHLAGSWTPMSRSHVDQSGGRLYATSLSICTLEVYYRHLPLYRSVAVE